MTQDQRITRLENIAAYLDSAVKRVGYLCSHLPQKDWDDGMPQAPVVNLRKLIADLEAGLQGKPFDAAAFQHELIMGRFGNLHSEVLSGQSAAVMLKNPSPLHVAIYMLEKRGIVQGQPEAYDALVSLVKGHIREPNEGIVDYLHNVDKPHLMPESQERGQQLKRDMWERLFARLEEKGEALKLFGQVVTKDLSGCQMQGAEKTSILRAVFEDDGSLSHAASQLFTKEEINEFSARAMFADNDNRLLSYLHVLDADFIERAPEKDELIGFVSDIRAQVPEQTKEAMSLIQEIAAGLSKGVAAPGTQVGIAVHERLDPAAGMKRL